MKDVISVTKNDYITLASEYSRSFPDPLNKNNNEHNDVEHHILLCRVTTVPSDISLSPNPRTQKEKLDYGIYKQVKESLENEDNLTFHLKNKGITILANRVEYAEDKRRVKVFLGEFGGIVDGGHTYKIILAAQKEQACPNDQFVRIEVVTGVSKELGVDIAQGLNTAVQVQEVSLLNLEGEFEWFKEAISKEPFKDAIAYKQNDDKPHFMLEILSMLTLFNNKHFDGKHHPKTAYASKVGCLNLYKKDRSSYEMLRPIVKDILALHDYINSCSADLYNAKKKNEGSKGMAGGMKGVFEKRKRGKYHFYFINKDSDTRLYSGTFYPIMGALRFLVIEDVQKKEYRWRLKSFEDVKKFYDSIAGDLIETTYRTSLTYTRKPDAVAKDDNHWENLYNKVALHYLTEYERR